MVVFNETSMNSTAEEFTAVAAVPLLESHPLIAVPYLVLTVLSTVIGNIGNFLILLVSALSQCVGISKVGSEFIVNLAFADLLVTAVANPFCIIGVVQGSAYFTDKDWLCELVASCCLTACLCAFFSLTVVTINRFVYVCHQNIYTKIFSRTKNILMCVCIWLASFTLDMPNFFGWGDHYFDMKNHSCIWDRTASLSYTMLVSVVLIMGSLCLMGFCHFRIFLHIHKSRTKVSAHRTMGGTAPANRVWAGNMKSTRSLCLVFVVFVICWLPYAIAVVADVGDTFPVAVHLYLTLLAHMHSGATFIIYCATNANFRRTLYRVLGVHRCHLRGQSSEEDEVEVIKEIKPGNVATGSTPIRNISDKSLLRSAPVAQKNCNDVIVKLPEMCSTESDEKIFSTHLPRGPYI